MTKSTEYVATVIAGSGVELDSALLSNVITQANFPFSDIVWLNPGAAVDLFFVAVDPAPMTRTLREGLQDAPYDLIVQRKFSRRKKLLVADMDSTMIREECLDELAQFRGVKEEVATLTALAMRGDIDFEAALKKRLRLLAGLSMSTIHEVIKHLTPTPGGRRLVATMRAHGAHTALVSGGFRPFTDAIAARLGFHESRSNHLIVADDVVTGELCEPVLGRKEKRQALVDIGSGLGLSPDMALAVGDGANDLDMLTAAGLGVAFHAKPHVAASSPARVDHADLTALLYAQGYKSDEFRDEPTSPA